MQKDNDERRTLTGRRVKLNEGSLRKRCIAERDEHIQNNLGNFTLIYPALNNPKKQECYDDILFKAEHVYNKFTGAGDVTKVLGYERMLRASLKKSAYKYTFSDAKRIYGESWGLNVSRKPRKRSKIRVTSPSKSKKNQKSIAKNEFIKLSKS